MDINNLVQTCEACPAQWEFTTFNNRPVYVRYRFGYLSVRIGSEDKDIMDAVGGKEIIGMSVGEGYNGSISWNFVSNLLNNISNDDVIDIINNS